MYVHVWICVSSIKGDERFFWSIFHPTYLNIVELDALHTDSFVPFESVGKLQTLIKAMLEKKLGELNFNIFRHTKCFLVNMMSMLKIPFSVPILNKIKNSALNRIGILHRALSTLHFLKELKGNSTKKKMVEKVVVHLS